MKEKMYFLILFVFIITSCRCILLKGHIGASQDIQESKKRGVFICEYAVEKNPYVINDTLKFNIKKAWLEKQWKYPSNCKETDIIDGYQIEIETLDTIKSYGKNWSIGITTKKYLRECGYKCLMGAFEQMPGDSITWMVQKSWRLDEKFPKEIIGEFKLVKRKF